MNDLIPELPKGVHTALYADDLVLWCTEEYAATANYRMRIVFDKVVKWAEQWRVTINRDKTTGTLFTFSPTIQPGILTLDDTSLRIQEQKTYLGVTFSKE